MESAARKLRMDLQKAAKCVSRAKDLGRDDRHWEDELLLGAIYDNADFDQWG